MIDLQKSRQEIDRIDREIVRLFEDRMKVALDVADYKKGTGKPVLDREREKQKLEVIKSLASNDFNKQGLQELFSQIMSMSRKLQYSMLSSKPSDQLRCIDELPKTRNTKVVFFGVNGSYTEQAMEECFGNDVTSFSAPTFRDVMLAVQEQRADYGVLPIENTTTGGINDSYDLLVEFENYIVGEHIVKVEQALLGLPDAKIEDVQTIYSHAQGILQCRRFLETIPEVVTIERGSTAGCAQKVLQDQKNSQAAIASVRAAKTYGLKILAPCINDEDCNSTRFIIITNKKQYIQNASKLSISFSLPHESGSLYSLLSHIIFNNLNMTKIESRPLAGTQFEYRFFVDFEGNLKDCGVGNCLRGIEAESMNYKLLGNYGSI